MLPAALPPAAAAAAADASRGESTGLLQSKGRPAGAKLLLLTSPPAPEPEAPDSDTGGLAALRLDCGGWGCSCGVLALLPVGHAMLCGVLLVLPPLLLPGARGLGLKRDWLCWWDDGDSSITDDCVDRRAHKREQE